MEIRRLRSAALASVLASVTLCAQAAAPELIAKLGWLQGCWGASDDAQAGSGEQWMAAAGGTIIGASRTIRGGKTVAFEFVQIREIEPGVLAYIRALAEGVRGVRKP